MSVSNECNEFVPRMLLPCLPSKTDQTKSDNGILTACEDDQHRKLVRNIHSSIGIFHIVNTDVAQNDPILER